MFSGSSNPIGLLDILCDLSGSQKSKMAASNLEIRISRHVDMIATPYPVITRFRLLDHEHGTVYQRQYAQHRLCCHLNDS